MDDLTKHCYVIRQDDSEDILYNYIFEDKEEAFKSLKNKNEYVQYLYRYDLCWVVTKNNVFIKAFRFEIDARCFVGCYHEELEKDGYKISLRVIDDCGHPTETRDYLRR